MDRMATSKKPVRVVFFQRKPRKVGNYSVEIYYEEVRRILPPQFESVVIIVPYESKGIIKRLYNAVYCAFKQGDINHITGDVHYVALFLKKSKTVLTVLDCGMLKERSFLKKAILKTFWFTLPSMRVNYITVISEATKKDLLRYIRFPESKVIVIYVSVSSSFKPAPKLFNKGKPVILQVGTAENKNIKRLAAALEDISCKVRIIGAYDESTEKALQSHRLDYEYVSRRVPQEEIVAFYNEADIIAFVSTFEGFGMPIIEGNIVGRVVITSNISSMPEVAGNAAHLVEDPHNINIIREGIIKIINDDAYRSILIENGFKNASRFSIDTIVNQHVLLYRLVTGFNG